MTDGATIGAMLASIKTATEIAKLLKDADVSLEKAELKLKLADLMGALADVKMEALEVQELVAARDMRVSELESALELKSATKRQGDAYYAIDEQGVPHGNPYCMRCWEVDHRLLSLQHSASDYRRWECPNCHTQFNQYHVSKIDQ